jgi:enoyl-CoA hydratase/carnithine racemase
MKATPFHTIHWTIRGRTGILTLNTPPSNAMTRQFFGEFEAWLDMIKDSPLPDGLIVKGSGRHFSSGAELEDLLEGMAGSGGGKVDHSGASPLLRNYRSISSLHELPVPVVAVIRGVCLGSAFELALHCHFRLCSADAVLGLPEATFNLMPGLGGIRRVAELSGYGTALQISLHGNTFGADDALTLGLVDGVLPKQHLESAARELIYQCSSGFHPEKRTLYLNRYRNSHGITA